MIKLIVAGSREFNDYNIVKSKLDKLLQNKPAEIISGMARGVDMLGVQYAIENDLVLHRMPANWHLYGKQAGMLRNIDMAKMATHCVVFRLNKSKGSTHMIETAQYHGLELRVYDFKTKE